MRCIPSGMISVANRGEKYNNNNTHTETHVIVSQQFVTVLWHVSECFAVQVINSYKRRTSGLAVTLYFCVCYGLMCWLVVTLLQSKLDYNNCCF